METRVEHGVLRRVRVKAVQLIAAVLLGACGGGGSESVESGGHQSAAASAGAVDMALFVDDEGWQVGVSGLRSADISSMLMNGVDVTAKMRNLEATGLATSSASESEFFFASNRDLLSDGLPTSGTVVVTTRAGASYSFSLAFVDPNEMRGTSTSLGAPVATAAALKVNWSKIWNTAKKMALNGVVSAVVKAYLKQNGYICPPVGPWWLCGRPVS